MSVRNEVVVHDLACVGCGVCVEICPPDVLRLSAAGTAYPAYARDCQACFLCVLSCPVAAVEVQVHLDAADRAALIGLQTATRPSPGDDE
jgi:NAD-dependent dihydropyrimidine dehydrogenase PreA subunit